MPFRCFGLFAAPNSNTCSKKNHVLTSVPSKIFCSKNSHKIITLQIKQFQTALYPQNGELESRIVHTSDRLIRI